MNLDFNVGNVTVTEFGVGRDDSYGQRFVRVPVDAHVQTAIREMVQATWSAMQNAEDGPARYEPSEKYGSTDRLFLPLEDSLATSVRELHEAQNLFPDAEPLSDPSAVFCYFARLTDSNKRRLTALRRSTQFKGIVKSRNRLVRVTR